MANGFAKIDHLNNFDQLRFIAASIVIFSHCFPLALGANEKSEILRSMTGYLTFGTLGVIIFFSISGYLITKSWYNYPNLGKFSWKRFIRIYPGLMTTILLSTFLIGPIISSLSLKDYFANLNVLSLVKNFVILYQADLPGVFINNVYPNAVNGSLWTLILEVTMYGFVALFGTLGILKKKWAMIIFIFLEIFAFTFIDISKFHFFPMVINKFAIYFLIGSCYFLFEKNIKYDYRFCVFLLIVWALSFKSFLFDFISYISIPYIVFSIGFAHTKYLPKFTGENDYSYGLYIYAFPIQQTIVYFSHNNISVLALFLIAYPLTLFLAYLSWNLIERKALSLKNMNFNDLNLEPIRKMF